MKDVVWCDSSGVSCTPNLLQGAEDIDRTGVLRGLGITNFYNPELNCEGLGGSSRLWVRDAGPAPPPRCLVNQSHLHWLPWAVVFADANLACRSSTLPFLAGSVVTNHKCQLHSRINIMGGEELKS